MPSAKILVLALATMLVLGIAFTLLRRSSKGLLTPAEFTSAAADTLRRANADLSVSIVQDLTLKIVTPEGRDFNSYLFNAYDAYKQDPAGLSEVLGRQAAMMTDIAGHPANAGIRRDQIVPVIKNREWVAEARARGSGSHGVALIVEELNSELYVTYAEDRQNGMAYFGEEELAKSGVPRDSLRALACANLKRILPKIERHGEHGTFMFTAGGDYESSLILLERIWTPEQCPVDGDVVFAVPTRDVLIATGSHSAEGLASLKASIGRLSSDGSYRISSRLFVMRGGRIDLFEQP